MANISAFDDCTPVSDIESLVMKSRKVAASRKTHDLEWRKSQLRAVIHLIEENSQDLSRALRADMGQPEQYFEMFERATIINMAGFALDHLDEWTKTKRVPTPYPTSLISPVHSEVKYFLKKYFQRITRCLCQNIDIVFNCQKLAHTFAFFSGTADKRKLMREQLQNSRQKDDVVSKRRRIDLITVELSPKSAIQWSHKRNLGWQCLHRQTE